MMLKVATAHPIPREDGSVGYIFISKQPPQDHKFDLNSGFCLLCLGHKDLAMDKCPGLLNPAIKIEVRQ